MEEKIYSIIRKYQDCNDVYMEKDGHEYSLEEELIYLFKNENVPDFSVDVFNTFDCPSGSVYAIAVAYINSENKLEMITDSI